MRWQDVAPVVVVVLLFVVGFVLLLIPATRQELINVMDDAGQSKGAAIYFSLVFVVSIMIGLPSVLFVVAAGIVWGGPIGFLSVWIGGIVGAAVVYRIGITWLKGSLDVLCWNKSATLKEVKKLISDPVSGWKWALLIRLPYMPYPQMSYALSAVSSWHQHANLQTAASNSQLLLPLFTSRYCAPCKPVWSLQHYCCCMQTDMTFFNYMWTSAVGSFPGVFAYIYLGTGIKNLREYMKEGSQS